MATMRLKLPFLNSYFQRRALQRAYKKVARERRFVGLSEAQHIGIICEIQTEEHWDETLAFASALQTHGAKVWIFGLYQGNIKPLWLVETLSHTLCSEMELNSFNFPSQDILYPFAGRPFDILIDVCTAPHWQSLYVATLSLAHFKVGPSYPYPVPCFDYLIEVKPEYTYRQKLEQWEHYITLIHT